jgi:formylglycine-generating enzyme required for sulfatase activity
MAIGRNWLAGGMLMFRQVSRVAVVVLAVGGIAVATAAEPKTEGKTKSPPKELTVDLGKGIKLEMVLIPAGEFMMGSPDSDKDADADEKPQHRVRITKPFYLGKYLVTQEQWEAVTGRDPGHFAGVKNPVEQVSWDDCQKFLARLNTKSAAGRGTFQLPSEAHWEYACRAESKTRYCFGDDEWKLGDYAWYAANSDSKTHPIGKTHPVGEKKPNAWGLYDMHGNVWEWCQDWHGAYGAEAVDDPSGPTTGSFRVLRGGSWAKLAGYCRSAYRYGGRPENRTVDLGLRVSLIPADKATAAEPTNAPPKQITNSIGMKLTLVPSGEFLMGSKESAEETLAFFKKNYGTGIVEASSYDREHPQHRVRITKPFYLGTYHVTRGQFRQFVADTGYKTDSEKGKRRGAVGWNLDTKESGDAYNEKYSWRNTGFEQTDEHPVVNVSWNDAVAFCKWLSGKENKTYRLPTEAEREYACRAGTTTRYYSGDDPETLAKVGNVADATLKAKFPVATSTIKASDGYVFTSPVGSFRPNAFGLYDMHGNAWQWCSDWYGADYYAQSPTDDPTGPDSGKYHVLRGGSFALWPFDFWRSAGRFAAVPDYRTIFIGFRVARTQ